MFSPNMRFSGGSLILKYFFYVKTFFGQIYMDIWSYGNTFWFISMLIKKKLCMHVKIV